MYTGPLWCSAINYVNSCRREHPTIPPANTNHLQRQQGVDEQTKWLISVMLHHVKPQPIPLSSLQSSITTTTSTSTTVAAATSYYIL